VAQTEKLLPQPQVFFAFGLLNENPRAPLDILYAIADYFS